MKTGKTNKRKKTPTKQKNPRVILCLCCCFFRFFFGGGGVFLFSDFFSVLCNFFVLLILSFLGFFHTGNVGVKNMDSKQVKVTPENPLIKKTP